ncbi:MAG: glycoside hydrolase family 3 protein [Leptospiraceae bacterium]|nr:glycoside hydrolase family 3 protein [Leptospiraceae bacterium]
MQKRFLIIVISLLCFAGNIFSDELSRELKEKIWSEALKITQQMDDRQKVGQVLHFAIPGKSITEETKRELKKYTPGGVILFAYNLGTEKELMNLNTSLQEEMKKNKALPLFISTDQEGGKVIRVQDGVTEFPGAMAIGQAFDEKLAYKVGLSTSYQLNRLGINLLLAPDLDINNNPENPVINIRSFGSDAERVVKMGLAYERGARVGGALPVIKHFPGHGDTTVDSHKGLPFIPKNKEDLLKLELIPFKKAIESGASAVMSAHIIYPLIEKKYPATLSRKILNNILRKELGFDGMVMTDAMEMDAISKNFQKKNTGSLAIYAGADVVLLVSWGENIKKYYNMIYTSLKKNKKFRKYLELAVARQVAAKIRTGLLHEEYSAIKIEDQEIAEMIGRRKREALQEYTEIKSEGLESLNLNISQKAIRSYEEAFTPLDVESLKNTYFFLGEKAFSEILKEEKLTNHSYKQLATVLKKEGKKNIVLYTNKEKSTESVLKFLKKYEKREDLKFTILHGGNPFFPWPKKKNVKVLFSFSPTEASKKALLLSLIGKYGTNPIPAANLIFERKEKPEKPENGTNP